MFKKNLPSKKKPAVPATYVGEAKLEFVDEKTRDEIANKMAITFKILKSETFTKMRELIRTCEADCIDLVGKDLVNTIKELSDDQPIKGYTPTLNLRHAAMLSFNDYIHDSLTSVDKEVLNYYSRNLSSVSHKNLIFTDELKRVLTTPNQCAKEFASFLESLHSAIIKNEFKPLPRTSP